MYTALTAASDTLVEYLRVRLSTEIDKFDDGTYEATASNPQEMTDAGSSGLSVWLYRVVRDEQRVNAPPERVEMTRERPVPLPLRLHYLVTPIVNPTTVGSPGSEQKILGRVLQALHDGPVLRGGDLKGDFSGTDTRLIVRLESLSLEEITRIWEALQRSYQLSVSYEMTVVYVDSRRTPATVHPVEVAEPEWGVITAMEPTSGGAP